MPWTSEEIVKALANMEPNDEVPAFQCFFCGAEIGYGGLEQSHKSDCVWKAARDREAGK